jgi:glycosyltransferase involved in cell wall biosynthesis
LEIAYVGYLNFKKGPMELMYALEALRRRDGRCRLHVAGVFQDLYSETACRHFLAQNHLEEAVRFHGWVQDVPAWLADKNAIICTSLSESQGLGLMEAMAMGVKPLIYNFHTAEHIYPRQWLWNNLDELAQMLHQAHDPQEVRRFVEENYSLDLQVGRLLRMLQGREEVVFAGPIFAETPLPPVPKECLAENLESRALANKDFGLRLLGERRFNEGITFLERAAAQSRYRDESCLLQLQKGYLETGRLTEAAGAWRTRGMQAALSGDYQTMLLCFAEFYYFMYKLTGSYKYQGFDQAIDTVLGLVAEKITPVPGPAKQLEGIDPKKIKVAMVLDSLDVGWATVKRFVELGKNLNKDLFEVVYLSVMEPQPSWDKAMADLTREGCRLVHYSGHEWLPKIKMMLHSLRSIDCDFLLLNTPYVTPYYHLLALCRPARKTIKFVSQGGGRESGVDIAWSSMDGLLIDEVQEAKYIGPAYVIPASKKWRARPRRPGELKAVAVGRPTKFMNNHGYWRAMRLALEAIPNLGIDFIGVEAKEVRHVTGRLPSRARFLGFQTNVVDLLPQYDVLVDTWPGGGGSTIREASAVGVPVISVRADLYEHYDARAKLHVGCNEFVHPELLLPTPDAARLVEVLRRLADDPDYHRRVAQEAAQIPVLSPERAIRELEAFLLATATTWRGPRLS